MDWVIILLIVIGLLIVFKVDHLKRRFWFFAGLALLLLIYITFTISTSGQELDLTTGEGVFQGIKVYFSWLGNSASNMKAIAGSVIGMSWNSEENIEKRDEIVSDIKDTAQDTIDGIMKG